MYYKIYRGFECCMHNHIVDLLSWIALRISRNVCSTIGVENSV